MWPFIVVPPHFSCRRYSLSFFMDFFYFSFFYSPLFVWARALLLCECVQMCLSTFILILFLWLPFVDVKETPSGVKEICWLHIQKTGSWIGDYILKQHCPNLHEKYNNYLLKRRQSVDHFLYDLFKWEKKGFRTCSNYTFCPTRSRGLFGYHSAYNGRNRTAITNFRLPIDRIISAYLFGGGLMTPHGMSLKLRSYIINLKRNQINVSINTYTKYPGIEHCQTKMVLGYECAKEMSLNNEDFEEAKRRIKYDFLFIGLTEFPLQTEELYRFMFPKETTDIEAIKPYRKVRQNSNHNNHSNYELRKTLEEKNFSDFYDDQLYQEALNIFKERCSAYNISL